MFFDVEITDDLFNIPVMPPPIRRQHGSANLLKTENLEVNLEDNMFRSMPNLSSTNISNLPMVKRHKSDTNTLIKTVTLKRIKTF